MLSNQEITTNTFKPEEKREYLYGDKLPPSSLAFFITHLNGMHDNKLATLRREL